MRAGKRPLFRLTGKPGSGSSSISANWPSSKNRLPNKEREASLKTSGVETCSIGLTAHQDGWLALAFIEEVPISNNQAERDIRCLKTKQKIATNFQTIKGAKHYALIKSFTSTLRKHSINIFRHLIDVLDRKEIVFQAG